MSSLHAAAGHRFPLHRTRAATPRVIILRTRGSRKCCSPAWEQLFVTGKKFEMASENFESLGIAPRRPMQIASAQFMAGAYLRSPSSVPDIWSETSVQLTVHASAIFVLASAQSSAGSGRTKSARRQGCLGRWHHLRTRLHVAVTPPLITLCEACI